MLVVKTCTRFNHPSVRKQKMDMIFRHFPTTVTTAPTTTVAPTTITGKGKCESWCASHKQPWKHKCGFKNACDACAECVGE